MGLHTSSGVETGCRQLRQPRCGTTVISEKEKQEYGDSGSGGDSVQATEATVTGKNSRRWTRFRSSVALWLIVKQSTLLLPNLKWYLENNDDDAQHPYFPFLIGERKGLSPSSFHQGGAVATATAAIRPLAVSTNLRFCL